MGLGLGASAMEKRLLFMYVIFVETNIRPRPLNQKYLSKSILVKALASFRKLLIPANNVLCNNISSDASAEIYFCYLHAYKPKPMNNSR